ncbi:MAG: hypothetical protein C6H99_06715 [Epsilonproteobacteria bacterium]|nr:hypothetical protein [Campylobacterota bacterium]NPA64873.1 hypothetical protein [Campylobacterota bacterium]
MKRQEELLDSLFPKDLYRTLVRYGLLFLIIVVLAVYIGNLLFGVNSLEVLYNLGVQEKTLKRKIEFYKRENARLQKEYFELKELEPKE